MISISSITISLIRQSEIVILSSVFEACSVVEPAGTGLVASSPDVPAQVVGDAVPPSGEQVDQAFYFGDGEWDQSGISWWNSVGGGRLWCEAADCAGVGGGDGGYGEWR